MNPFVKHLWRNNRDEIVTKSRLNCHVKGLHSVMLLESPGKTVRLFVTTPDHVMHLNKPRVLQNDAEPLSLGFHPHHCNLTLQCVKGVFTNWRVALTVPGTRSFTVPEYEYSSKLLGDKGGFVRRDRVRLGTVDVENLSAGDAVYLRADELHTVYVPEGLVSAWLVFEGEENGNHSSSTYSNADLTQFDFEAHYQRPDEVEVCALLHKSGLL
jgi:hypothetical protein